MKVRILPLNGRYWPQSNTFFVWDYYYSGINKISFDSWNECRIFLENKKSERNEFFARPDCKSVWMCKI